MSNHDREEKRDATLDRAWRQASDEQPPAQLDAAIIASARKAVQDRDDAAKVTRTGRRSRNWLTGWQPLAAAAGVAGLAFVLVQSLPRDGEVAPATWIEEPVSGSTGVPDSLSRPSAREAKDEKAAGAAPARAEVPADATNSEHMKRTVPPTRPPPASVPPAESAARVMDQGSSAAGSAAMRAAEDDQRQATVPELSSQAASEAAVATARQRDNVTLPSAEDWAARVEALYTSGDVVGAADALHAFRVADPDADTYLPDSLRNWAQTVE